MTAQQYKEWEEKKEEREELLQKQVQQAKDENKLVVSKRGVYRDLSISPYKITKEDGNGRTFVFRFSSQTKMNKFETEMKLKTIQLENSFKRIYGQEFDRKALNFDGLVYSMWVGNYNKLQKR